MHSSQPNSNAGDSEQGRPKRVALIMFLIAALGLYCSWQLYPRWTMAAAAISVVAFLGLTLVRGLVRGTSVRTLVVLFPIAVAILCIPARRFVAGNQLRAKLLNNGITQFELGVHPNWTWVSQALGTRRLNDQLRKLRIDLDVVDLDDVCRLPQQALIYVVILRDRGRTVPPPELAECIHGSPALREVDIRLGSFTDDDLRWISSLRVPCRLSIRDWKVEQPFVDLPTVTHFNLTNMQLNSSWGTSRFSAPKLESLTFTECELGNGQFLGELRPARRLDLIRCVPLSRDATRQLVDLPTRVISLMEIQVPDIELESISRNPAEKQRDRFGLMLFSCQFSGDMLVKTVQRAQPDELLIRGSQPLSVSQLESILRAEKLRHLILEGAWVSRSHLEVLSQIEHPLKLELADFALPQSDEQWLRENASDSVQLVITNRILNDVSTNR